MFILSKEQKRRTRFGIVTNRMSDKVYNLLDEKGKSNELTQYIIDLVEKDIEEQETQEKVNSVNNILDKLEDRIKILVKEAELNKNNKGRSFTKQRQSESLVDLNFVSDEEIVSSEIEEDLDLNF